LFYKDGASKYSFPTGRQGTAKENSIPAIVMPFHGGVPGIALAAI